MIICMERYFAIIYPITCKQILTPTRLRVSMIESLNYFSILTSFITSAFQKYVVPQLNFSQNFEKIGVKNCIFFI